MQAFTHINGLVLPMDRANVDTDAIIPKQYLKSIHRSGFGANLFDDWRYLDSGEPGMDHSKRRINPKCILNQERYGKAEILLARENFGCGSSREHAVWALVDFGIKVIIAPTFADIFYNNTVNNGVLALTLPTTCIDQLFSEVAAEPGYRLSVDLESTVITTPHGENIPFSIEEHHRHRLLNGLDDIGITLLHAEEIRQYEQSRKVAAPWLY